MSLFKYTTTLDSNTYEIEADYYEVQEQISVNLRGEKSIVFMCVFYEDNKIKKQFPRIYIEKIFEVP